MSEEIHGSGLVYDAEDEYRPEPVPAPPPASWLDGSFRIGIHTSIAGDIANSLEIAKKLGCNALQIFSSSPRMWPRPGRALIPEADAAKFRARRAELALGPVAIHANYLINLAASDPVARVRAIQAIRDELLRGISLGADFVIVHPGSARDGDSSRAARDVGEALRQSTRGLKLGAMRVLVENTAGMGNAVGSRFEELAAILESAREIDAGVCLDTAHTFEAGYPIHTADGLEHTLEHLERTVELDRIHVLHVNDSKTAFGSRVDRHEHIGKGEIGLEALGRILRHPLLSPSRVPGRAFLLETPIDVPGDDRRNVAAVWKLVGVAAEQAPDAEDGFSMVRGKSKIKRKTKVRAKPKATARAKALTTEAQRTQRGHGETRSRGTIRSVARGRSKTKSKKRKRG